MTLLPNPPQPSTEPPCCAWNATWSWLEPSPFSSAQSRRAWLLDRGDQEALSQRA